MSGDAFPDHLDPFLKFHIRRAKYACLAAFRADSIRYVLDGKHHDPDVMENFRGYRNAIGPLANDDKGNPVPIDEFARRLASDASAEQELVVFWSGVEALLFDCVHSHISAFPQLLQKSPVKDHRVALGALFSGEGDQNEVIARETLKVIHAAGGAAYGPEKLTRVFEFLGYGIATDSEFSSRALVANAMRDAVVHAGSQVDKTFQRRVPFLGLPLKARLPLSPYELHLIYTPIHLYIARVFESASKLAGSPTIAEPFLKSAMKIYNMPPPPAPYWREPLRFP
jgi:hypothetical protein